MATEIIKPGFIAFHGNRTEDLVQVLCSWIQRHPLPPLEAEIILVQSNGMAEWVKMELARIGGVCAATRVELPSRFLWRTYRQVLGRHCVPSDSPLDKVPMIWRLMRLLPELILLPDFAPVAGFLKADEPDRMLQLAAKLADLFDQYQNYRADWLNAWAAGQDHLLKANGEITALPPEQRWQPQLWRAVLETLTEAQTRSIRPKLHQQVLDRLNSGQPLAASVAQRVLVFGMSHIPWSTLQTLAALAAHSQVMLFVPNPCRFYWGDIMDGRELLRALRRRQPLRCGVEMADVPLEDMHAHAHPLLAAWGQQSRDFIRQLDVFDDAEQCRREFDLVRSDLFDDAEDDEQTSLLQQVQNRIRDLTPLAEHPPAMIAEQDRSIVFHSAHSHVRELEILHDQLLQLLALDEPKLNPRDVIVMVPDIERFAPAIRAVFGLYKRQDARYIPYDIADMSTRSAHPLHRMLDWLLRLPAQRARMSELQDLLELPQVSARFGIAAADLQKLIDWMSGAGIRWGLNVAHRADLDLADCGEQNSAWFGLQRMLLGFASGTAAFAGIEPYAEVGGLEAELAGSLAHLLQKLLDWWSLAREPAVPVVWAARCRALLASLVQAQTEPDRQILAVFEAGLEAWLQACDEAAYDAVIPLAVLRSAWLEAMEIPTLNQRFRAGGVTFCTLMPMRAIPFEVICLLGMNDGDYPRRSMRSDFDLMGLPGISRPGDRSRRSDDRQMMLEALLSARRMFYLSWCGRSVRDNSLQPPSVLVSQFRDYLCAGWDASVLDCRTTQHPLQPFSRRYFELDSPLISYASEWRTAHEASQEQGSIAALAPFSADVPVTLGFLEQFLKNPVKAFFRQRLQVIFANDVQENVDDECFAVDGLQKYQMLKDLLRKASQAEVPGSDLLTQLRKAGELPLKVFGDIEQEALQSVLSAMLQAWDALQLQYSLEAERCPLFMQVEGLVLEDWIDHLRSDGKQVVWLELEPGKLLDKRSPRPEKLLGAWLRSLAIAVCGVNAQGYLVGQDGVLRIMPVEPQQAMQTLRMLLSIWLSGMHAPLPLPLKTALAFCLQKNPQAQYEGGYMQSGEVEEPCMARVYPDFEALQSDGSFAQLALQVYEPLQAWVELQVSATPYASILSDKQESA